MIGATRPGLCAARDGATAIEFAVLVGMLAFLVLGIIDFGRLFWERMEVQNAAQAAADYLESNTYDLADVQNTAIDATDLALTTGNIAVIASGHSGSTCGCPTNSGIAMGQVCGSACVVGPNTYGTATGFATVTVTYNFTPLFPWPGLADPTTLSGSATAICKGGTTC